MNEGPPSTDLTRSEIFYLTKSFAVLWFVFLIANLIVFPLLLTFEQQSELVENSDYYSKRSWPSSTPTDNPWPTTRVRIHHASPMRLVRATIASGIDSQDRIYFMDVFQSGYPFVIVETKKTRITQASNIIHEHPPAGQPLQMHWRIDGILLNPLLHAAVLWLFIGFAPVWHQKSKRIKLYRKWAKRSLCPGCGYEILDLPICPECGRHADAWDLDPK